MIARTAYPSLLLALLLGLAATALLTILPRLPEQVFVRAGDIGPFLTDGETAQLRNFFGFYAPETADANQFRWTTGAGSFVVRNGARLGTPLLLRLRLCGCRLGEAVPPHLRLRVDGATLADMPTTAHWGEWRRYALLLPPRAAPYSPDLFIELRSNTVPNAETGQPLGIAFDWARLVPLDGMRRAYRLPAAAGLGALVGGLALVAGLRGFSLRSVLIAGLLGLALAAAQGALYRAQPLPAGMLAGGLLLGLALALALGRSPGATTGLALALGALVLAPQLLGFWMLDDAFISFRYARNALLGAGFVFNPGERVEGYTNFLWTALFVPILGASAPPAPAALAFTLLLALATAGLTWAGARRLAGPGSALAALAPLIASAPFVLYTARGSGMETALFTLLVLGGMLLYLSHDHRPPTTDHRPAPQNREPRTKNPDANREPRAANSEQRTENKEQRAARELSSIFYSLSSASSGQSSVVDRQSSVVGAGVLLALAAMTRPEGLLVAGITGLHLLYRSWRAGGVAWRRPAALAGGFLAIFGPYFLWRLAYYGYLLPNTFYAKVGGTAAQALRGLDYAAGFATSQAPLLALALVSLWHVKSQEQRTKPALPFDKLRSREVEGNKEQKVRNSASPVHPFTRSPVHPFTLSPAGSPAGYLWQVVGIYTLYIIAVGGDHFPLYRFFVPLLPPLALLAALALRRVAATPALALVAAACVAWQLPQLYDSRTLNTAGQVWGENSVVEKNREIGLWLRENTPPGTLIATGIAGALPYYAERPVLDSLGLNDLHIAHLDVPTIGQGVAGSEKTDVAYVLGRRPAYIPHNSSGPFDGDPAFTRDYVLMLVRGPEGRGLRLYRRADLDTPGAALDSGEGVAP